MLTLPDTPDALDRDKLKSEPESAAMGGAKSELSAGSDNTDTKGEDGSNAPTTATQQNMSADTDAVKCERDTTTSTPAAQDPEADTHDLARQPRSPGEVSEDSGDDDNSTDTKAEHATDASNASPPLPNEPVPSDPAAPPLPNEPVPSDSQPPLPAEPTPQAEDSGWSCLQNPADGAWWYYNRFTQEWRPAQVPDTSATAAASTTATAPLSDPNSVAGGYNPRIHGNYDDWLAAQTAAASSAATTALSDPNSLAGGYNPAIHGDYDENAWYAVNARAAAAATATIQPAASPAYGYAEGSGVPEVAGYFNKATGRWQQAEGEASGSGGEGSYEANRSRRQTNVWFDVDAAANMHDGKSLKAERAGKKPSKAELKMFKERRKARKEEKRRAWLRD